MLPAGRAAAYLEALAFTYAIVMAVGFLYRGATYSRVVIGLSALALFVYATITRVLFRVFLEFLRKRDRKAVKILMVGTDRFARRVTTSLEHGEVFPCRVVGFVRLEDQEVAVEGPVYELNEIPSSPMGIPSTMSSLHCLPPGSARCRKSCPALEKFCAPTRVIVDLGESVGSAIA